MRQYQDTSAYVQVDPQDQPEASHVLFVQVAQTVMSFRVDGVDHGKQFGDQSGLYGYRTDPQGGREEVVQFHEGQQWQLVNKSYLDLELKAQRDIDMIHEARYGGALKVRLQRALEAGALEGAQGGQYQVNQPPFTRGPVASPDESWEAFERSLQRKNPEEGSSGGA